ncbi:MAG TPA: phosphoribosylanthranilate isomerase [Dissulfurispiraceae bacterium]|nr:phosphoribosylanthranilate isomerase [Dissulfurispiraceae bacterium]
MKVKICGITNLEDALAAVEYGADALGFVFYPKSPRVVTPEKAKEIVAQLPPFITTVGVFVNEDPVKIKAVMTSTHLSVVQLHGEESPAQCTLWTPTVKAFRVKDFVDLKPLEQYKCMSAYLLDTFAPSSYGGTGQIFNWDIALEAKKFGPIILAGGLTTDNVEKAVRWVMPYAVDVSSGVEAEKGKKDLQKMKEFIDKARKAALCH